MKSGVGLEGGYLYGSAGQVQSLCFAFIIVDVVSYWAVVLGNEWLELRFLKV